MLNGEKINYFALHSLKKQTKYLSREHKKGFAGHIRVLGEPNEARGPDVAMAYRITLLTNQRFRRRVGREFFSAFLSCTSDNLQNSRPERFGG